MANFERMANGNIEAHLTEEEARVIQSLTARVGGVKDTAGRLASDRVLESLDGLLGQGQGGDFYGSVIAVDTSMYDLPEGEERSEAFAGTMAIEELLWRIATTLGMVDRG